jgi:hypothetical protein
MKTRSLLAAIILSFLICGTATGFNTAEVEESARQGLVQILDLWRIEDYERLYTRLTYPPEQGWDYFASRIVYASRIPACCWEKLQNVTATAAGLDSAVIHAKVGLEVEGVGTRFETRAFHMERIGGVWKLPMREILDLSRYNLQRIPRKIYERPL